MMAFLPLVSARIGRSRRSSRKLTAVVRAGEDQPVDARVGDQRRDHLPVGTPHELRHRFGNPCIQSVSTRSAAMPDGRRRRFDDHRRTRRESGEHAGGNGEREIPRRDHRDQPAPPRCCPVDPVELDPEHRVVVGEVDGLGHLGVTLVEVLPHSEPITSSSRRGGLRGVRRPGAGCAPAPRRRATASRRRRRHLSITPSRAAASPISADSMSWLPSVEVAMRSAMSRPSAGFGQIGVGVGDVAETPFGVGGHAPRSVRPHPPRRHPGGLPVAGWVPVRSTTMVRRRR